MEKIYLYTKESPIGLKYLGQTTKNPFTYKGSGKYWKRHLKAHNLTWKDLKTVILFETIDREDLKEKGLHYSLLWDIVESKEWANLCLETGEHSTLGYKQSQESIEKTRRANTGRKHTEITKKKMSEGQKGKIKTSRQMESVASIWKGKSIPAYIKKAVKKATAHKIIHILSGKVLDSIKDTSKFSKIPVSSLTHSLKWANYKFGFRYLDENRNLEALERKETRTLKYLHRGRKNLPNKSSKFVGVCLDKSRNKWVSMIRIGGKRKHLGRFNIEKQASEAYQRALKCHDKEHEKEKL